MCKIQGCPRDVFCKGMCRPHYRAAGPKDTRKRPTKMVDKQCPVCGVTVTTSKGSKGYCPDHLRLSKGVRPQSCTAVPKQCSRCGEWFIARNVAHVACGCPKLSTATGVCRRCGGPREDRKSYCESCRVLVRRELKKAKRTPRADHGKNHRKRAKHYGVAYETVDPQAVYARDGWVCGICGKDIDPDLRYPDYYSASLDHVVPLSKGGDHLYTNVQASHFICNSRKSDGV